MQEPILYTKAMVSALLAEYAELLDVDREELVILRCDLEVALTKVCHVPHVVVTTVMMMGADDYGNSQAVTVRAVTQAEWEALVAEVYKHINGLER